MSNFHVGQKVVCVDASIRHPNSCQYSGLTKGDVYTITHIDPFAAGYWSDAEGQDLALWLDGAQAAWKGVQWPICSDRFRPVAEKPASMDIIRAIVADPSKPLVPTGEPKRVKTPNEVASTPGGWL